MKLILFNGNRLQKMVLPKKMEGSFWLTDELNNNNNIVNIESSNNKWIMKHNEDTRIIFSNSYVDAVELMPNYFYFLEYNNKKLLLYTERVLDQTIKYYKVEKNSTITIGKDNTNDIFYENNYITNNYVKLTNGENFWTITINQSSNVYINNALLKYVNKRLNYGDSLFILGLKLTVYKDMISINNPSNFVNFSNNKLTEVTFEKELLVEKQILDSDAIKEIDFYTEDDFFFKKPRLRRFIEEYELQLTPPPRKSEKQEMPLLLTLGPALTMGLVSVMTLVNSITKMSSGNQSLFQSIISLVTPAAMLMSSLLWPNLTKRYQKNQEKKKEKLSIGSI